MVQPAAVTEQGIRDEEGMRIVKFKRAVCEAHGVTMNTVSRWKQIGMPCLPNDEYDLDAIDVWKASSVRLLRADKNRKEKIKRDVMALRANTSMGVNDIAEATGLPVSAVRKLTDVVDKYRPDLEHFKANKADYFTLEQMRYLDNITEDKLAKTTARDLRAMAKTAWEQERIERGESVDNVAVIVKHINMLKEKEEDADPGRS